MPYLKNPSGRIVAIDDDLEFEKLSNNGFSKLTKEEEEKYIKERFKLASTVGIAGGEEVEIDDKGIYLQTVSEGGADGYGVASEKLVKELIKSDISISRSYKEQKIGFLFHNPYSILKMENPVKVIYTMFESTKIPDDWKPYLESADRVVVPSKWCQGVFEKAGIKTQVIPLGYDSDVFKYHKRENKREKHEPFVFLHYNAFNIRKGFVELFEAFTKEFKNGEPVKLILKTTLNDSPFPILKEKYPNIEILFGKYSEAEMVKLINKSDCFVFPSRGEGFGMTPLECMATGLPVIVPNAHGISEYFDKKYMYEVKVEGECPAIYQRYKGENVGKMSVVSVDDLRKKMRYVYEHQKEALEVGKRASKYAKKWTFKKCGESFKKLFDELYDMEVIGKKDHDVLQLEEVK